MLVIYVCLYVNVMIIPALHHIYHITMQHKRLYKHKFPVSWYMNIKYHFNDIDMYILDLYIISIGISHLHTHIPRLKRL